MNLKYETNAPLIVITTFYTDANAKVGFVLKVANILVYILVFANFVVKWIRSKWERKKNH